jgi:hypothetical protein
MMAKEIARSGDVQPKPPMAGKATAKRLSKRKTCQESGTMHALVKLEKKNKRYETYLNSSSNIMAWKASKLAYMQGVSIIDHRTCRKHRIMSTYV